MDKVTWRAGWIFNAEYSPFFVGLEKGFWVDEGIYLTPKAGIGIPNTNIITAGLEKFAGETYIDLVVAIQSGMPLKAVYSWTQGTPIGLISRADNPILRPKDLEGKTIASGQGSSATLLLPAVMEADGADISKVTSRIVDWGAVLSMLILGKVDAIPMYWTNQVPNLEELGLEVVYWSYADFGVDVIGSGIILREDFIAENPELIRRFIRALQNSWAYTLEHTEETLDIFIKYNPTWADRREALRKGLMNHATLVYTDATEGKPLGWMAKEDWERSQDLLIEYMGMDRLPVETYYTNEFIPQ